MITLQQRIHSAPTPAGWRLDKLHQVLKVRRGNKNAGMRENNLLSLSHGRIIRKNIEADSGLLPESFETYQIVEPGDIIMRLTDLQNDKRSIRQGLVRERGIITSAYDALEVVGDNDSSFWAYALLALDLAKYYYSLGGGVRQSVKFSEFPNERIYRPDLATQKRIAAYLGRQTSRIDALIEKNERLIEILTEKTYSDLFRCVFGTPDVVPSTYDPSVQMVRFDFGKIKIRPLKSYVSFVGKGSGQTSDICDDGEIPYITTEQMETGEPTKYTNKSPDGRKGDIALCTIASVGKSVLLPFDFRSNPQVSILRVKKDHNGWVAQALRLLKPVIIANANMSGVMPYINAREVGRITLPDLSFEEQASRFEKAWEISNRGYWLSKKLKDMNVLLKEKRSALITAAVTGQLDIPE